MAITSTGEVEAHPTLVFDVSTVMRGTTERPHGVLRVVFETAMALFDATGGGIEFTSFNPSTATYSAVSHEDLRNRVAVLTSVGGAPTSSATWHAGTRRSVLDYARSALRFGSRVAPATAQNLSQALVYLRRSGRAFRAALHSMRPDYRRHSARRRSLCHSTSWTSATTYCTMGLDFAYNDLQYLKARKSARGFRVAMTVYDLIPLVAPQYTTTDLTAYFTDLVQVSDSVFVISECTERDLMNFVTQRQLRQPQIWQIPLSSSLIESPPSRPDALPAEAEDAGFAIYVSSITSRKNHQLLLDVWSSLLQRLAPTELPFLILAGSKGSLSDETMSRIHRDPMLRNRVLHLAGLADAEVAWLYQACAFTLYPSLYEGWGLPVTESLDFGRVCVASDRTSLPEAGEGLAIHLDPTDRAAWTSQVLELWRDNALRERLEERIARQHIRVDVSRTASSVLTTLGVSPPPASPRAT